MAMTMMIKIIADTRKKGQLRKNRSTNSNGLNHDGTP